MSEGPARPGDRAGAAVPSPLMISRIGLAFLSFFKVASNFLRLGGGDEHPTPFSLQWVRLVWKGSTALFFPS